MGSDMVAALSRATMERRALFGHNSRRPFAETQTLIREPGKEHAAGEVVALRHLEVPQVRQTCAVLGGRPAGLWGYLHGINEYGVAVGVTQTRTRLHADAPGLEGHELTRLALERSTCARQAVDVIIDHVSRHGQGTAEGEGETNEDGDNAFLIVDGIEAFVVEAAGKHWAEQEVKEVRAVAGMCQLRQDWDRISRGLSDLVIERGWWAEDGTKVDFAEAVGKPGPDMLGALRRWGRATLRLEEHNGRIDLPLLRRLLSGADDGLCVPPGGADETGTASSLIAELAGPDGETPVVWCALGTPSQCVYFPVTLAGDLPVEFSDSTQGGLWQRLRRLQVSTGTLHPGVRSVLTGLQLRFDQLAREFKAEADTLKRRGEAQALERLATSFMEHAVDCFNKACDGLGAAVATAGPAFPNRDRKGVVGMSNVISP